MSPSIDLDSNGVVTESEIAASQAEIAEDKADAQRHMAWVAMITMIVFTAALFLPIFPDGRIKALSDLFGLFYIGMASVVGAYMGMSAWMAKKK
tara:strand:+ start:829 stop:1110 length:282 start_codon:yes stop_codon:yes gene_type:complete